MNAPLTKAILLSPEDNVATLLADSTKGQSIEVIDDDSHSQGELLTKQAITFGNKIAVKAIPAQGHIFKSGYAVGIAIKDIPKGELVHVQNVRSNRIDIPEQIIQQIIQQMQIED